MRTLLLPLPALLLGSVVHGQVTTTPLDLSQIDGYPYFFSTPSHDVAWAGLQGVTPSPWGFIDSKIVVHTNDAGASWLIDTVPDPEDRGMMCVFARGADTAWVGLANNMNGGGAIWKTTDGGASWTQQTTTEFSTGWLDQVHFFDATDGLAIGDPNADGNWEVYTTTDGGTVWTYLGVDITPAPLSSEYGMYNECASYGDSFWLPTSQGRVLYTTDRGASWAVSVVNSAWGYFTARFHDELNGIAHDYYSNGPIMVTSDGGVTWTPQPITPNVDVNNISLVPGVPGAYAFKGGDPAKLYVTTDNFVSYTLIDGMNNFSLWPLHMADATIGWTAVPNLNSANGMYKISGPLTGVGEPGSTASTTLGVFPNPVVSGAALVTYTLAGASQVELILRAADGHELRRLAVQGRAGGNAEVFDLRGVPGGSYLLTLQGAQYSGTTRVVVN